MRHKTKNNSKENKRREEEEMEIRNKYNTQTSKSNNIWPAAKESKRRWHKEEGGGIAETILYRDSEAANDLQNDRQMRPTPGHS